MKRIAMIFFSLLLGTVLSAVEVSQKEKIVVLPFKNLSSEDLNVGDKMASSLAGKLADLGRFEIIDRTELEKIMGEQKLALMGVVEQAYEVGKISASKMSFSGTILAMNLYQKEKKKEELIKLVEVIKGGEVKKEYEKEWNIEMKVNFKVIDIESGQVIDSFEEEVLYRTEDVHTKEAAVDKSISILSSNAVTGMREIFALKTYIITKKKRDAIIRLGKDMGLKKGMEFKIYSPSKKIDDKFGNKQLTVQGDLKGLLYITDVSADSANAKIVRGASNVKEGDIIKEKLFPSINLELSIGTAPFKINGANSTGEYSLKTGGNSYDLSINYSQKEKDRTPYINLNIGGAYRPIRPSIDFTAYLNDPMAVYGIDLNLNMSKGVGDFMELTGGFGLGLRYAYGVIGDVSDPSNDFWDYLFGGDDSIKSGEDITLEGLSFAAKAKTKVTIYLTDTTALILETGYTYSKIGSWDAKTKTKGGEDIKIANFDDIVGDLDMTGVYGGLGLRWTF